MRQENLPNHHQTIVCVGDDDEALSFASRVNKSVYAGTMTQVWATRLDDTKWLITLAKTAQDAKTAVDNYFLTPKRSML